MYPKIILLAAFLGGCLGLNLTPPENQWVRLDKEVLLSCQVDTELKSCSWSTPYGEHYPLFDGIDAEDGRLVHVEHDKTACNLKITKVMSKDLGAWICRVATVNDDSKLKTASGRGTLSLVQKPDSITFSEPFNKEEAEINNEEKQIQCLVANAKPKPNISWFVGEEELVGYDIVEDQSSNEQYSQTLRYSPLAKHANQTLRCVVDHLGLEESDPKEVGVTLKFTEDLSQFEEEVKMKEEEGEMEKRYSYLAVGIVAALILFIIMVMVVFKVKKLYFSPNQNEDCEACDTEESRKSETEEVDDANEESKQETSEEKLEKLEEEEEKEEKEEQKEEKEDEKQEKEDEEPESEDKGEEVKSSLKEKMANFFALKRTQVINKEEKADFNDEKEVEQEAEDGVEKTDQEKPEPKPEKKSRFSGILKIFNLGSSNVEKADDIIMEEAKDVETVKDEGEAEKKPKDKVDYEAESAETMDNKEKEEGENEKPEPEVVPRNTSV